MNKYKTLTTMLSVLISITFMSSNIPIYSDIPVQDKPILRLNTEMHTSMIRRIDVDRNGVYFVSSSDDKTVKLWSAENGALIRTLRVPIEDGNEGKLYSCAISPDGSKIITGGWTSYRETQNNAIYVFNTVDGELSGVIKGLGNVINDLEYSNDGNYVAAALGGTSGVVIIDIRAGKILKVLPGYNGSVQNTSFSNDGRLATVCNDGYIRLYDSDFNEQKKILSSGGSLPYSIAFSPDASRIAIGHDDTTKIQVLSGTDLELLYEPNTKGADDKNRFLMVNWSQDGRYLYAGGFHLILRENIWWSVIRRWDNQGRARYRDISAGTGLIMDIKPLSDGSFLTTSGRPDIARVTKENTFVYYRSGEIISFRNYQYQYFGVDQTGSLVSFRPFGKNQMQFDLVRRELRQSEIIYDTARDSVKNIKITDWLDSYQPKLNGESLNFLEKYETNRSASVSGDGKTIILGADWYIYALSDNGTVIWKIPVPGNAWAVNIVGDTGIFVYCCDDGTIRWNRVSDGKELLALFVHPDEKQWILWTPEGYYDFRGTSELIGWHLNRESGKSPLFLPASKFFDTFYRPDIVSRALSEDIGKVARNDINTGFKLPPVVSLFTGSGSSRGLKNTVVETADYTVNENSVNIEVRATNSGGGIARIRVFSNDKLIIEDTVDTPDILTYKRSFKVTLSSGLNRLKVVGYSLEGTEGVEDIVTYRYIPKTNNKPDMYIIAVGINKYKNSSYNLNYCVADIEGVVSSLVPYAEKLFGNVFVTKIYDEKATRDNVLAEFIKVKSAIRPEDVFILYYSGHGQALELPDGGNEFFYVLHGTVQLTNLTFNQRNSISGTEMRGELKEIRATKQLMFVDACNSGAFADQFAMKGAAEENALAKLSKASGTMIFASTGSDQFAMEFTALGHGSFTYTIIDGLKGGAFNNKGELTVNSLNDYLYEYFPLITKQYKGEEQYPKTFIFGMPFPIGLK